MVWKLELLPQVNSQLPVQSRGEQTGCCSGLSLRLLSSLDKGNVLLATDMFVLGHGFGDSLHNRFQHLVMSPVVVAFSQGFWRAAEDLLLSTSCHSCQTWKFAGLGRTLYTAWTMNLIRWGSARQMSVQDIFISSAPSHLVHGPCCRMPTILLVRSSSNPACTLSRTSWRLTLPWTLS